MDIDKVGRLGSHLAGLTFTLGVWIGISGVIAQKSPLLGILENPWICLMLGAFTTLMGLGFTFDLQSIRKYSSVRETKFNTAPQILRNSLYLKNATHAFSQLIFSLLVLVAGLAVHAWSLHHDQWAFSKALFAFLIASVVPLIFAKTLKEIFPSKYKPFETSRD